MIPANSQISKQHEGNFEPTGLNQFFFNTIILSTKLETVIG